MHTREYRKPQAKKVGWRFISQSFRALPNGCAPFLLSRKADSPFVTIPTRGEDMDILAQLKAARDKAAFELGRLEAAVSALSGKFNQNRQDTSKDVGCRS
jgi:hypothetical protein